MARLNRPMKKSFLRDRRGVAAVEFALTLPFLLLIYFGGVELTQGVTLNRQVALTATTIATIVSQYTTISASTQLSDILAASTQILAPYGSATPQVVVSLITIDANKNATITWSQTLNGTARIIGTPVTVPTNLDIASTTLIWSETRYAYTPAFDFMGVGPFNLYASIYMVPRESNTINLTA
jgi:Flp pilus assembly protein TadG